MSTPTAAHNGEVVLRPRLNAFTYTDPNALLAALGHAREAGRDPEAWLVIERHVRRALPRRTDEDMRQNALLAIVVYARTMGASDAAGARAWLHAVCRSQLVNELRTRYRVRLVSVDHVSVRSHIVAPTVPRAELAENVLRWLDELIVRHARTRSRDANSTAKKIAQARAAIRRVVLEETLPDIMAIEPASLPLVAKWIERGRKVVLDAIDAERAVDPDGADLLEPIAALMRRRRADAGKPRPERRARTN
jgi:hypothetical protein